MVEYIVVSENTGWSNGETNSQLLYSNPLADVQYSLTDTSIRSACMAEITEDGHLKVTPKKDLGFFEVGVLLEDNNGAQKVLTYSLAEIENTNSGPNVKIQ